MPGTDCSTDVSFVSSFFFLQIFQELCATSLIQVYAAYFQNVHLRTIVVIEAPGTWDFEIRRTSVFVPAVETSGDE